MVGVDNVDDVTNDNNDNANANEPHDTVRELDVAKCFNCGHNMKSIQSCHLKCLNCGSEMDCSDKGWIW